MRSNCVASFNSQGWRMMSEQDYLTAILPREQVGGGLAPPALFVPGEIRPIIEQSAGRCPHGIHE